MGESKSRARGRAAVLAAGPSCIYCGGKADTIEHMPPIGMFAAKRRPQGLEFPACRPCNNGSSHADLVAALLCRVYSKTELPSSLDEFSGLLRRIRIHIPGILDEMRVGRAGQKLAANRLLHNVEGHFLRVDGPLVSKYMTCFAVKLGVALHHAVTSSAIAASGAIAVRWFCNFDKFSGVFPDEVTAYLPEGKTLRQGSHEVSEQFEYSFRMAEDLSFGMYFAAFGASFSVLVFIGDDFDSMASPISEKNLIRPSEIVRIVRCQ